jgi:membrane associated rhomboid family serine protease
MPIKLPPGPYTQAIMAVTSIVWIALWATGWLPPSGIFGGFIPARVSGAAVIAGALPVWITPLSAALLHASLMHLGFNMLTLAFCGRFTESAIGPVPYLVLYVVGAYAAAAAQFVASPSSPVPMIGASGAISAVVGAYAMLYGQQKARAIGPLSPTVVRVLWLAAAWIVVQWMFELAMSGSMTQIAIAAHIGGFIAGLLLARPLLLWRYRRA